MTHSYKIRFAPLAINRINRRGIAIVVLLFLVLLGSTAIGQTTYTWQGADGGSWIISTNWTPERTTPATTDVLQFTDGSTKTVTAVPTETIAQLFLSGNTTVTLQAAAAAVLTVGGATDADLVIPAGSALNISGASALSISLATGATGSIGGSMTFSGGAHRLLAVDASGITFQSGSVFSTGTGFSGNVFGTTFLNSVIFAGGSTYIHVAGSNPFGAGQPSSVVVFQTGSLYKAVTSTTPAFSGRTYANFEMDAPGVTLTTSGASKVSIDNLTITNGTLNFNMTATPGHSIKGDIYVATGATLNFNPATAGTVNINGTAAQTISGPGTINTTTTTSTINISNAAGVTLNNAATFYNLTVSTGPFKIASGASLITKGTVTGSVTVERYISAWTDASHGWHFLSSPVASQAIDPAFTDPTPANYDFYAWGESVNLWLNQKVGANNLTSFVPGTGYLVAYAAAGTKQFNGDLNNANVTASNLTLSGGTYSGWNLLGNPFPCAIKWNDGVNWTVSSDFGGVAKIWNEPTAAYVDIAANGIIPAVNGFMVQVVSGSPASLTIPVAARVHDATPWYKEGEATIKLLAYDRSNNTSQEAVIGVNNMATEGFDAALDCRFLPGYAPHFYSVAGSESLSTNTLPAIDANTVVEMGFVKNQATEFSIGLDPDHNVPALPVYLTDRKSGAVTELSQGTEYHFTSSEGDEPNRFLLHFGPLGIDDPDGGSAFNVYAATGTIYILSGLSTGAEVVVSNLLGQVVMRERIAGNGLAAISAASVPDGIYIVTVNGGGETYNRKVMVTR